MSSKYRLKTWQELHLGGVIATGGNAADYETGTWRTWKPLWYEDRCTQCLTCWAFCPEEAFLLKDGKTPRGVDRKEIKEINYYHCKGCGLCVKVCPVNKKGVTTAIELVHELS